MVMPRVCMRKIREVLRLKFDCRQSSRNIAASCGMGRTTVGECISRFRASGLRWPLGEAIDDAQLEQLLYPTEYAQAAVKPLPDWSYVHRELCRKGVTKQLVWEEYKAQHKNGYQYTQFCHHYRQWRKTLSLVFRNEHKAGEKTFIDYAGHTVPIYDPRNGGVRRAQIFIAVLGASNYTYAEATWSQSLVDWLGSNQRAFEFFGGTTEIQVPDNLKSAVNKACRYDPELNPAYYQMARHYKTAIIPARARKPKDKAKAEAGVLLVERWILARLRKRKFFSLEELNEAIGELLAALNNKPFKKMEGSRRSVYEQIDRQALRPLPDRRYETTEVKFSKVNIDYHIEVDQHYYSVPHTLVGKEVEARYTKNTVEIVFNNRRIASHKRSYKPWKHTTLPEHMPESHREHAKWTPERMLQWIGESGQDAAAVAERIMDSKPHPQQGFKAVLGLIRLGDQYGPDRLNKACGRALHIHSANYQSVKSILKSGLDQKPLPAAQQQPGPIQHQNIRGADFFH